MCSFETQHAHLHRLWEYIGGVSLQSQEIRSRVLTKGPAKPALYFTGTTSFA